MEINSILTFTDPFYRFKAAHGSEFRFEYGIKAGRAGDHEIARLFRGVLP